MKIAVVGCGAVGSYYGGRLAQAGHELHFLLRSDWEAVRRNGVHIFSPLGNCEVRPHAHRTPAEIGPCEVVLIALKTTANDQFPRLLPPLVGPETLLLTLQNGLGNEAALAALFPARQVLGGLCFVYLNRTQPGVVHHFGEGRILLGEFTGPAEPRTHRIAAMFQAAQVPCHVTDELACAHWEKLVWNIPFNGLGVASAAGLPALRHAAVAPPPNPLPCLTTGELLDGQHWEALVRELMAETIATANGLGHALAPDLADKMIAMTRATRSYKSSTVLDFEAGRPLEIESLFRNPLCQAQAAGVATPRLARMVTVLDALNSRRVTGSPE